MADSTAAAYLQRAGFAVTVYEQTDSFSRIGAGIILGANAFRPLAQLGLGPGLVAAGITPDRFLSRAWDTGETVYELCWTPLRDTLQRPVPQHSPRRSA